MNRIGKSWNQLATLSTRVSPNILPATSSCLGFTTPKALQKAPRFCSIEIFPSPLNLGKKNLGSLVKSLLVAIERRPIAFPHGYSIIAGTMIWFF